MVLMDLLCTNAIKVITQKKLICSQSHKKKQIKTANIQQAAILGQIILYILFIYFNDFIP